MNRRRRPLKLHLRAAPKQKIPYRSSPKFPLKVILTGVCLALITVGALSFGAFTLIKNSRSKHQGHAPVASPSASALLAGSVNPVPTTVASPRVAAVSATPSPMASPRLSPTASPGPTATPVTRPTALIANDNPRGVKTSSEVSRKTAEQRRREAERKRARLEAQHKNHEISDEAYKKGQQEYQAELAKYHSAVGGAGTAN
jgi:hypothetical protein